VTVTAINVPAGIDGNAVRKAMRVERGFVLGGGQARLAGKIIRIGTMGDISQTDVLEMLGALEMELLAAGLKIAVGTGVQAALRVFREAGQPIPA
jgi:aspartate aminotransferase-like enzyme